MNKFPSTFVSALLPVFLPIIISAPALAMDARSAALGGSAIANGKGVHGALENPASLMNMQREEQRMHFHLGLSTDIQDSGEYIGTALDNETLPEELESAIDNLSNSTITCDENSNENSVCVSDTQRLSELSTTVLGILNDVNGKPFNATAAADFGVAYTQTSIPVAIHYRQSVTGAATTNVSSSDLGYIETFANVTADDVITVQEIATSAPLSISEDGQTLSVQQPEDVLTSEGQTSALIREQLGLSIAGSLNIAGFDVDLGVTPKFSELRAASLTAAISDGFDDESDTFESRFEESETVETAFNIDVGASLSLASLPLQVSVVARNMINETITTKDNFKFETTPQLIVGGALSLSKLTVSADIALNEAKLDNLDTQILALGIDMGGPLLGLRAGVSHDTARTDDATALSLGFSLGPVHIGGRLTDRNSAQAGAQLAFSF